MITAVTNDQLPERPRRVPAAPRRASAPRSPIGESRLPAPG